MPDDHHNRPLGYGDQGISPQGEILDANLLVIVIASDNEVLLHAGIERARRLFS